MVNAGSCIIVPYRRTASLEFLSCVRTRLLLSRHTILYLSGSFTNKVVRARGTFIFYSTYEKRRNYRYIQIWNRQGMLKGKRLHFQLTCVAQKRLYGVELPPFDDEAGVVVNRH